jgi:HEAT repeat protein
LQGGLKDPDSAVRYWAATGFLAGGKELASANAASLAECLKDPAPSVRIVAAEALARYTTGAHVGPAIEMLLDLANLEKHGFYTATMALNALDHLGPRLQGYEDRIRQLPLDSSSVHQRVKANIGNLVKHILSKT